MIPAILSQTARSERLPREAETLRDGWIRHNPGFEYRLYDDEASRAVFAEVVPEHLALYDALPFPVMRADLFRYAVIYRDGGFYADIDMQSLKPVPDHFRNAQCLLAVEAHLSARRGAELDYAGPVQIANCIFAAVPRHPFMMAALTRALSLLAEEEARTLERIEDLTGPRMLTRLLFEDRWPGITVLPQIVLMAPLHYPNIWPVNRNMIARHRTFGSWKSKGPRPSLQRRWIERNRSVNPFAPVHPQPADEFVDSYAW